MKSFKLSQEIRIQVGRESFEVERDRAKTERIFFLKLGDTEVEWKHPITSFLSKEEISPLK
jgi:hypothetical protein